VRVFAREIRITGSTVFSAAELAQVTAPYVHRTLATEDVEELRQALTRLYVDRGYINSGAIIPDQTVSDGVITLQVIEGELTEVVVTGNRWFRNGYLRPRLRLDSGPPLHLGTLQQHLQRLQQDPRIARLHAELQPGALLGESILRVQVQEALPFFVAVAFNNHQSPDIGAERGLVTVAHRNLTGYGDTLWVTYGRSAGLDLQLDARYTLPLTARDTAVTLRYQRNNTFLIEAQLGPVDVTTTSDVFGLTLWHPVYRTPRQELALALTVERLHSDTRFALDDPRVDAGLLQAFRSELTHTPLRLALEWLDRGPQQVLAARSRFSVGVNALGATIQAEEPDGRFFTWVGQMQWARRLTAWDLQALARLDVQLATEPLFPLERIAIGGSTSVRGYRENQLVRDNGLVVSVEARLPLVRNTRWAEVVQLVPFVDFGRGWNVGRGTDAAVLLSVGLGLRWVATLLPSVPVRSEVEIFWGHALKDVQTSGGDLQDLGLHLQWVITAF
jgi:hemolysin activation/secretion protein